MSQLPSQLWTARWMFPMTTLVKLVPPAQHGPSRNLMAPDNPSLCLQLASLVLLPLLGKLWVLFSVPAHIVTVTLLSRQHRKGGLRTLTFMLVFIDL